MPFVAASPSLRRAAFLVAAAGLAACTTLPEPPPAVPVFGPVRPPVVASSPAPAPTTAAPAPTPAPSGLASRFPEPSVNYRTPAFQLGHGAFTSAAEAQRLLQGLARDHAAVVRVLKVGEDASGAALEALLFSRSAQATPDSIRASGRATVVLHGPQRADAPAATEALLVVAQELARGRLQSVLDKANVIVWPLVPAPGTAFDGDHLLLKTPQTQALARLVREYQPAVVAEVAEYLPSTEFSLRFSAVERHDAMLQYAAAGNLAPFVTKAAEEWFRQPMLAALQQQGLAAEWHYGVAQGAVERRLAMGSPLPDNSRNVQGLKNAVSLTIESRGEASGGRVYFKRRVHTLVTALGSVLESAGERSSDLLKIRQYVDAEISAQACKGTVVVEAGLSPGEHTLQMLDAGTGAEKSSTVAWDSALALRELQVRPRPCGYWLDASESVAVARLRLLGVRVEQVLSKGVVQGDTFVETAANPREVKTVSALLDLAPGGYYVPLSQPLAHVAVAALEPDTAFSYWAGGLVTGVNKTARVMAWPGVKTSQVP
ncbi:peptidase M14 [Piscinibacter gummiphilus]|uniref:Peptidase M14 n=1 Tax=Piscinibacter gummiphilus TaxID=946333 RepID=A0ABZ0CYM8_9BURK|nr:peptidase M14 [Piscinibacter gummiphilus]WOB10059.1 peptidase M14 [Piscinibacter gummiphilus]